MELLLAGPGDAGKVESLLCECGMPFTTALPAERGFFVLARDGASLAGVAGIETRGALGLLRSLAVASAYRKRGCGARLVAYAERVAAERGVETVYLLTTSAAPFFAAQGYFSVPHNVAPQALLTALESGDGGSGRGVYMSKRIGAPASGDDTC